MVYLFLAEGFEEVEALTPVDLLRRAGVSVTTVGIGGKTVRGSHGIEVSADISEDEAKNALASANIEMVVLPGGGLGSDNLCASETVSAYLDKAKADGAFIAAICAAPYILGVRGLLKGHMATCYPGFEDRLEGAEYYNCDVIRDGEFITGRAAGAATEFALELISALCGDEKAEEVKGKIIA